MRILTKQYHGVSALSRPEACTDHGSEYSFVIPHDMETLIDFMGGPDTFERRLDTMVGTLGPWMVEDCSCCVVQTQHVSSESWCKRRGHNDSDEYWVRSTIDQPYKTLTSGRNEPDFATPYLYNYINKQAKSVQMSRSLGLQ